MVASIGAVASPAQGITYYERDGYYARDDPAHKEGSAWIEANVVETRMKDPETGRMVRAGGQSMVAATFQHGIYCEILRVRQTCARVRRIMLHG